MNETIIGDKKFKVPLIVAHRINTKRLTKKIKKTPIKFIEIDVRKKNNILLVEHGSDIDTTEFFGPMIKLLYKLLIIKDPLKWPITLEEYLNSFGKDFHFLIDLKSRNIESDVIKILEKYNIKETLIVSSGYHDSLKRLKNIAPYIKVFLGNIGFYPVDPISLIKSINADGISIYYKYIDEALVNMVHIHGYKIAAWTVNTIDSSRDNEDGSRYNYFR
ncbi:MAG: glycerophosphodiester phosphodiesterase [Candidatus Aenigmatarchaeota archaeon]